MEEYRKRIRLSEDVVLSIIKAPYSHGGPDGLYEIAIFSNDGDFITHQFFPDIDDDVIGWLTLQDVDDIVAELKKEIMPL